MSKFFQELVKTNNKIKETRARRVANSLRREQMNLVNNLQMEIDQIDDNIEQMLDMHATSTTDLTVGKGANAEKWVNEYQNLQLRKTEAKVKLAIAQNTFNEWFKDEIKGIESVGEELDEA